MDRYKFRGKRLDNGEWAAGHYLTRRTKDSGLQHMISVQDMWGFHEVDPATVGQYTGLKDKNGKEIYEGDIVKQTFEKEIRDWDESWTTITGHHIGVVVIDKRNGVAIKNPIRYISEDDETLLQKGLIKTLAIYRTELLGNIHDNPELLEG